MISLSVHGGRKNNSDTQLAPAMVRNEFMFINIRSDKCSAVNELLYLLVLLLGTG